MEKTQHLLWPIFANPDRSTLYGNVAASAQGVFFRHIGQLNFSLPASCRVYKFHRSALPLVFVVLTTAPASQVLPAPGLAAPPVARFTETQPATGRDAWTRCGGRNGSARCVRRPSATGRDAWTRCGGAPSWRQGFEGPTTSWIEAGSDAQYTLVADHGFAAGRTADKVVNGSRSSAKAAGAALFVVPTSFPVWRICVAIRPWSRFWGSRKWPANPL